MANKPENLKPFLKGYDPRRGGSKKGQKWAKTKFKEFVLNWCEREGKNPDEIDNEAWDSFRKLMKHNFPAIKEYLDRRFGTVKENLDITSGGKPIPLLDINKIKKENDEDEGAKSEI